MFDFLKALLRPAPPSSSMAKERLRLVLLSDQLSLAPDVVEALKKDLLAVISRYVTIDSAHADVTFEHRDKEVAMLANIPITGVRGRTAEERSARAAPPAPEPAPKAPEPAGTFAAPTVGDEPMIATGVVQATEPPISQPEPVVAPVAVLPAPAKATSRRRRRKKPPTTIVRPGYSAQG